MVRNTDRENEDGVTHVFECKTNMVLFKSMSSFLVDLQEIGYHLERAITLRSLLHIKLTKIIAEDPFATKDMSSIHLTEKRMYELQNALEKAQSTITDPIIKMMGVIAAENESFARTLDNVIKYRLDALRAQEEGPDPKLEAAEKKTKARRRLQTVLESNRPH